MLYVEFELRKSYSDSQAQVNKTVLNEDYGQDVIKLFSVYVQSHQSDIFRLFRWVEWKRGPGVHCCSKFAMIILQIAAIPNVSFWMIENECSYYVYNTI